MSSATTLRELAEKKRLLVLQADLHRQIIGIERLRVHQRFANTRSRFQSNRWLLLGLLGTAGWLSTRKLGALVKIVPIAMTVWRMVQKFGARP